MQAIQKQTGKLWSKRIALAGTSLLLAFYFLPFSLTQAATSSTSTLPNFIENSWYVAGQSGGLAVDNDGNVYVPRGGSDIIMYSGTAASTTNPNEPVLTKTWTGFSNLSDIAVDDNGYVYVTAGNTVQMFSSNEPSGTPSSVTTWTGFSSPWGIDVDDDGDIVTANNGNGSYRLFNRSAPAGAVSTKNWTGVNDAWTVAFDDEGNIYGGGWSAATIKKFHKSEDAGTPVSIVTWNGLANTWLNAVHWGDGYVYYASNLLGGAGSINRIPDDTPSGNVSGVNQLIGTGSTPYNIATDDEGNVYGEIYDSSTINKYIVPQNLAQLTIPGSTDQVSIELPGGNHITAHSIDEAAIEDEGYEYPLGLVNFSFRTSTGGEKEVDIYFQTDLAADEVTPRKFNSSTEAYSDIPGTTITETTWGGQPALQLSYTVEDGGDLDEDGEVNGTIVDPVGLATIPSTDDSGGPSDPESEAENTGGNSTPVSGNGGVGAPNTGLAREDINRYVIAGVVLLLITMLNPIRRKLATFSKAAKNHWQKV